MKKKFNLDGPDGFSYYWHDLRNEKLFFSKRTQGGGSVMIWGGFSLKGKTELEFTDSTMNSKMHKDLLVRRLLPFGRSSHSNEFIFQQDNAPCHSSEIIYDWVEDEGINHMNWPSFSPDLNPIENFGGKMARRAYADGSQFSSITQLKEKIIQEWNNIPISYLKKLIGSMPIRMFEVAKASGGSINY
jgi:hypothetical protein